MIFAPVKSNEIKETNRMFADSFFKQTLASVLPGLVELRRDLHAHPQTGFQETYALEKIQQHLNEAGIEFVTGLAETGLVGYISPTGESEKLPAIALRADMDALPICEQTNLPYASRNEGVMHACGHDGHVAMLVGAAKVLGAMRDCSRLVRPVKFIFQPAEEGQGGAKLMLEQGALSADVGGIAADSIFALHAAPSLELGTFGLRTGPAMASVNGFRLTVTGKGGHGAKPHETKDPIVAAAQIVTSLQTIVSRNLQSQTTAIMSVCSINGGSTSNIIPDDVELQGTIRAFDDEIAEFIQRKIAEISTKIAEGFGCTTAMEPLYGYPVTVNDPEAAGIMRSVAEDVLGKENVIRDDLHTISEDFSYYARQIPGCIGFLGTRPNGTLPDDYPQLHNPGFDFNDDALPLGIEILSGLVGNPA